jgi:CheY-like chemotaxis protein
LLELDSSADECRVVPELDRELTMSDIGDSPLLPLPFELLVVDDSRLCRKMLQKCLRADGHTCTEAQDGLEAVAMVKKRIGHANGGNGKPFDAILIDFIMPNMDGPTATKEIRALGYTAPIFGVTGNGEFQL